MKEVIKVLEDMTFKEIVKLEAFVKNLKKQKEPNQHII